MTTPEASFGSDFQFNTYTTSDQGYSSITGLAGGGFVVTWESLGQDGAGAGIYAQIYDASGSYIPASEFRVNTTTAGGQSKPAITALSGGGFVVTWVDDTLDGSNDGVYAQIYTASGTKTGSQFKVNTTTASAQNEPAVFGLAGGGFIVTWESLGQDGDNFGVYAQRYTATGTKTGSEFQVNTTTTSYQSTPQGTELSDGSFVLTWISGGNQDGSGDGIFAQRFSPSGVALGSEFQVNNTTTGDQGSPTITGLNGGGFVVTWQDPAADGSSDGIYARVYNSSGVASAVQFLVNTTTANVQSVPVITALSDGGFVVVWQSNGQDGSSFGIYGQLFDSSGTAVGSEFLINNTTANSQNLPSVTALSDGGFAVSWTSVGQDGAGNGVFGQMFSYADGLFSAAGDTVKLYGPGLLVNALAGNDTVTGADYTGGGDVINGNEGSDTLLGLAGDDILSATTNLQTGDAGITNYLWGGAGDDTLYGAEGDDLLVGGAGQDRFHAGAGDDWIYIDGDDITTNLHGGAGLDRVFVNTVNATFVLDVTAAQVEVVFGGAEDDTLDATGYNSTVYLIGAAGDDTVTGGNAVDVLWGYGDQDTLSGNGSTDWLYAGTGSDSLTGGAGDDFLIGGAGLGSGDGALDTFYFGDGSGTDRVYEFDDGVDMIDMTAKTGLSLFSQLTIFGVDGGANTAVVYGGDTIYLIGIVAAQLTSADFIL